MRCQVNTRSPILGLYHGFISKVLMQGNAVRSCRLCCGTPNSSPTVELLPVREWQGRDVNAFPGLLPWLKSILLLGPGCVLAVPPSDRPWCGDSQGVRSKGRVLRCSFNEKWPRTQEATGDLFFFFLKKQTNRRLNYFCD